jgi:hypothetical protein
VIGLLSGVGQASVETGIILTGLLAKLLKIFPALAETLVDLVAIAQIIS